MTRKLTSGLQHNLYIPNAIMGAWERLVAEADSRHTSPSKIINELIVTRYKNEDVTPDKEDTDA